MGSEVNPVYSGCGHYPEASLGSWNLLRTVGATLRKIPKTHQKGRSSFSRRFAKWPLSAQDLADDAVKVWRLPMKHRACRHRWSCQTASWNGASLWLMMSTCQTHIDLLDGALKQIKHVRMDRWTWVQLTRPWWCKDETSRPANRKGQITCL